MSQKLPLGSFDPVATCIGGSHLIEKRSRDHGRDIDGILWKKP